MKILVSGSTGLIGQELISFFKEKDYEVSRLVRDINNSQKENIYWSPSDNLLNTKDLEGFDVIVHLAGENVGDGRWTSDKKKKILESRINGTSLLSQNIIKLNNPPKVFISASAIGYYGDRGNQEITENSNIGTGFLSEVCEKWEEITKVVQKSGIRTVNTRFGIVLSKKGGALEKMLFPFKMGLGGNLGKGEQYMSWISLDDVVRSINHIIHESEINGPVNIVSPNPVKNSEFTKTLGKVLHRPTIFPLPEFAGKLAFGEMADEMLFSSLKVKPEKLINSNYEFIFENLENALNFIINNKFSGKKEFEKSIR